MIKKVVILGARLLYSFFKVLPTQNKITMISRQSNSETVDFRLLRTEIEKENEKEEKRKKIKVVTLCHKLEGGANAKFSEKIKYGFHMLSQMHHIATSKVLILDSYCILASILKHKKDLKIIQMWHSMGTMKKFGYQILDKTEGSKKEMADVMRMHKNYNYVFASSKAYAKQLAEGFGCETTKIRIYSLPRVDLLTSKEYKKEIFEKIKEKYPEISAKKNILYCPTFRKEERKLEKEIYNMIEHVDFNKYNLIIKLHPLSKIELKEDNKNVILDKSFSSMEMLFIADYLISDYSCIIYEAAVLNIPLFFFAFDLQEYLNNRGLTIDYEKVLPGIVSSNAKDIITAVENNQYDINSVMKFREKYVTNTKDCTKKIVDFIKNLI